MFKYFLAFALAAICYSPAYGEVPTEQDLWACYELEFEYESITPEAAYLIGQCFSDLAAMIEETSYQFYSQEDWGDGLSNKNAVLHYADSWFLLADYKGHPNAQEQLQVTRYLLDN